MMVGIDDEDVFEGSLAWEMARERPVDLLPGAVVQGGYVIRNELSDEALAEMLRRREGTE